MPAKSVLAKEIFRHVQQKRNLRFARLFGLRLVNSRNVYPPGNESQWMASYLIHMNHLSPLTTVLDYGCGSGFLSLVAARLGAQVTAVDINPFAVALTRQNAIANRLEERVDVRLGDGMASIRDGEAFSLVIANIPFEDSRPNSPIEHAIWDYRHRARRSLFEKAAAWNTTVLLCHPHNLRFKFPVDRFSNGADIRSVEAKVIDGKLCQLFEARFIP